MSHWLKTGSIQHGVAQYVGKMCEAAGCAVDITPWREEKVGMQSHLQLDSNNVIVCLFVCLFALHCLPLVIIAMCVLTQDGSR